MGESGELHHGRFAPFLEEVRSVDQMQSDAQQPFGVAVEASSFGKRAGDVVDVDILWVRPSEVKPFAADRFDPKLVFHGLLRAGVEYLGHNFVFVVGQRNEPEQVRDHLVRALEDVLDVVNQDFFVGQRFVNWKSGMDFEEVHDERGPANYGEVPPVGFAHAGFLFEFARHGFHWSLALFDVTADAVQTSGLPHRPVLADQHDLFAGGIEEEPDHVFNDRRFPRSGGAVHMLRAEFRWGYVAGAGGSHIICGSVCRDDRPHEPAGLATRPAGSKRCGASL